MHTPDAASPRRLEYHVWRCVRKSPSHSSSARAVAPECQHSRCCRQWLFQKWKDWMSCHAGRPDRSGASVRRWSGGCGGCNPARPIAPPFEEAAADFAAGCYFPFLVRGWILWSWLLLSRNCFRRVTLFNAEGFRQAAAVALFTGEACLQEDRAQIFGQLHANHARPHHQHIHIIMLHSLMRRVAVMAKAGADARDFVGCHGGADAAATD